MASLRRPKHTQATPRRQRVAAQFRSVLAAFAVTLGLLVQLIAMPMQQAMAGADFAGSDSAAVAIELQAMFGDAAYFCVHIDDKGRPSPHAPCNHCDDQCQLCRSVAQVAAFVPPDAPALPTKLNARRHAIGAAPDFGAFSACPTQRNRARAPPLPV